MIDIKCCRLADLPTGIAYQCRELCHAESEMQLLYGRLLIGALAKEEESYLIGYATYPVSVGDDTGVIVAGWVSLTDWMVDGKPVPQLQGFVAPKHRACGIATSLCVCLLHGMPKEKLPAAVFSDEFFCIARRLRLSVTQYKHVQDGWVAVASRVNGDDSRTGTYKE